MSQSDSTEETIFEAARQLGDAQKQAAYLDVACGKDDSLRQRIEQLLRAGSRAKDFFQKQGATLRVPQTVPVAAVSEAAGTIIGRYKLLQQIGEGGCGVVYMAEQEEPVRRRVALKVIKLGMDTKQVIARFEAERQALALMDHPNIAKVLDAGATDTGRPYFVMELVRGIKITDYCDQNNLSTEDRLKLFTQVCQAIQHAHQKGIIHRDIKPSNILVTVSEPGAPGCPKVIDFGIAKATTGQRLTDKTVFTAFEQFIGTPAYMSPEQAMMTSLDIDTRTDIYALGVLLYELLTGQTPFDATELMSAGLDAMRRIIREQEPARPSTRLSTLLAADLTLVARHRHAEPGRLGTLLRGDLDWIVMKCLEKDRTRRYETANGLAMDVERHLRDEPVIARPPSALYRLQKSVRRNKTAFAATTAIAAVLVIGVVVSTWQAIRATRAEREQSRSRQIAQQAQADEARQRQQAVGARTRAEAGEQKAMIEAAKSQQVAQFLKDMLTSAGPAIALGRDKTLLREILDRTADHVNKDLTNQPEVQGELLIICGEVYAGIGEAAKAEAAYRQAVVIQRKVLGNNHPDLAETLFGLAGVLAYKRPEESETLFRESLEIRRKVYGNQHWAVAACLNHLAGVLVLQGKLAEAESYSRQALAMKRKLLSNELAAVSSTTSADQALAMKGRIVAHGNAEVAISLRDLALVLRAEGKLAEEEKLLGEALAIFRGTLGDAHGQVAYTLDGLAGLWTKQGKLVEAEAADREALAIHKRIYYDNKNPSMALTLGNLVDVLLREGKFDEVEPLLNDLLTPALQAQPKSAGLLRERGTWRARMGQWQEAVADFSRSVEFDPENDEAYHSLAPLLVQIGDLQGYRSLCAQELARFDGTSDPRTAEQSAKDCLLLPDSGVDLSAVNTWADTAVTSGKGRAYEPWFQFCKGLAEYRQGHFAGAVDWLQKVLSRPGDSLERDAGAYLVLAMAQHRSKKADEANASLAKGVEIAENRLPKPGSGDLGGDWDDWIIAHVLMREAKALIESQPATATKKKPEPH